jgi:hypothetical protein
MPGWRKSECDNERNSRPAVRNQNLELRSPGLPKPRLLLGVFVWHLVACPEGDGNLPAFMQYVHSASSDMGDADRHASHQRFTARTMS